MAVQRGELRPRPILLILGEKKEFVASPRAPHPQHPPRGPSCLGLLPWASKTQLLEVSPNTLWLHQGDIHSRLINPSARQGSVRSDPASGSPSWAASSPGRAQVPGSSPPRGCGTRHRVPVCATGWAVGSPACEEGSARRFSMGRNGHRLCPAGPGSAGGGGAAASPVCTSLGCSNPKLQLPAPSPNCAGPNPWTARCLGSCSCRRGGFWGQVGTTSQQLPSCCTATGAQGSGREGARATLPCASSREKGGEKSPETGLAFEMLLINSSSLSSESPS